MAGLIATDLATRLLEANESAWVDTATVYTRHATTGQYTVVAKAALRCQVQRISTGRQNAPSMAQRAEFAAGRVLRWEHDYSMPDNAQLEIGGRRWNLRKDTIYQQRAGEHALYWTADIVRVP
jgi:hypothetical protein